MHPPHHLVTNARIVQPRPHGDAGCFAATNQRGGLRCSPRDREAQGRTSTWQWRRHANAAAATHKHVSKLPLAADVCHITWRRALQDCRRACGIDACTTSPCAFTSHRTTWAFLCAGRLSIHFPIKTDIAFLSLKLMHEDLGCTIGSLLQQRAWRLVREADLWRTILWLHQRQHLLHWVA